MHVVKTLFYSVELEYTYSTYFLIFLCILSEKVTFYLGQSKTIWYRTVRTQNGLSPSAFTQRYFVPSLVEISPVVLEKKILNFINVFSPFGKRNGPLFELWIPYTQWCFVPSLVEFGSVVLEKKVNIWKVYRRTISNQKSFLQLEFFSLIDVMA